MRAGVISSRAVGLRVQACAREKTQLTEMVACVDDNGAATKMFVSVISAAAAAAGKTTTQTTRQFETMTNNINIIYYVKHTAVPGR